MELRVSQLGVALFTLCLLNASATVLYVDLTSTNPTPPYTNWVTAATNIQDAVDVASAVDQVLVTNGIYQTGARVVSGSMTNRLAVTKAIRVQSVNGPAVTVIRGYQMPGVMNGSNAVRCVYLASGARLIGFTLTNGASQNDTYPPTFGNQSGAGVWCESSSAIISNCVICGNAAYGYGAGALSGTLNNCILTNNTSSWDGGGAALSTLNNCALIGNLSTSSCGGAYTCTLNYCTLTANRAYYNGGAGGSCTLNNCALTGNSGSSGGGAIACTLNNCVLTGNSAGSGGGASGGKLNNCILSGNSAGSGGGVSGSTLNNCTLSGNSASSFNGGGGANGGTLNNCSIYYNTNTSVFATANNYYGSVMNYCCTFPQPGGTGNITNAPLFVNPAGGDFHLQTNSLCINAGINSYVSLSSDLDGNPRIKGGTVDIGAYECQAPALLAFYLWLQNYGLPTAASALYVDSDNDGMNHWQEWICGTNPTNSLSVLKMLAPSDSTWGITVNWQSASNRTYFLQRSTNLLLQPAFSSVRSNIIGQTGTTSCADDTATNSGPYFYRVGVQQ
jgi:hypothetical protein